ncbi:unnamed protein product [Trichogramma brassicae]|uniref:Uncharacterized protein n=1 Tax=Trichogramma brassicae TaxID=86971 RepID=A0A6H5J1Z4_9HYME|nr:unnamed protein product [Trichogramma brassicae]
MFSQSPCILMKTALFRKRRIGTISQNKFLAPPTAIRDCSIYFTSIRALRAWFLGIIALGRSLCGQLDSDARRLRRRRRRKRRGKKKLIVARYAEHRLAETRAGQASVGGGGHHHHHHRDSWRRPHIETDTYVFIPANMPFQDLVGEVLLRLNYSSDLILSARGSIVIRNWKPLATDRVADGPLLTVGDILAELVNLATLRIQIFRARPSPASEIRDKLLRLLLLRSHAVLLAAGCPLDEATLSSLCRGGNDISEETQRAFESWLQQQHLGLIPNSLLQPPTTNHHHHHPGLNHHRAQSPQGSSSAAEVVSSASGGPTSGGANNSAAGVVSLPPHHPAHPHHHHHHAGLLPFSHKSRMRTSFDPELELPRLQRWFGENQHPSRQQIQHYVNELNALESRRDRKPLHVNNVVYWFKNARAAQKRAENRGVNGYSPPGMSPRNASNVSEDCSDEEEDSRLQSASPSPCAPASPPVGPLSLTTRPEDQAVQQQQQQSQAPSSTSACVKQEDSVRTAGGGGGVSSGSEDDEVSPGGPTIPGFSLVPSPMFSHSVMYMSHYLSPRGPTGCPTSMLDERRKRNRTFIDPVTEVPRLETWFTHNTHPSHAAEVSAPRAEERAVLVQKSTSQMQAPEDGAVRRRVSTTPPLSRRLANGSRLRRRIIVTLVVALIYKRSCLPRRRVYHMLYTAARAALLPRYCEKAVRCACMTLCARESQASAFKVIAYNGLAAARQGAALPPDELRHGVPRHTEVGLVVIQRVVVDFLHAIRHDEQFFLALLVKDDLQAADELKALVVTKHDFL